MSVEAEKMPLAEQVEETGERDHDTVPQLQEQDRNEAGGDETSAAVDSVVATFFSANRGSSEKEKCDVDEREEWSSNDEQEARAQPAGTDTAEELQLAADSTRMSPEEEQQAMAETEAEELQPAADSTRMTPEEEQQAMAETEAEELQPAADSTRMSPEEEQQATVETEAEESEREEDEGQRRDSSEHHHAQTPDDSKEEDGADREGEDEDSTQERMMATAAPAITTTSPANDNQLTEHDQEKEGSRDGKGSDDDTQDRTQDFLWELDPDQRSDDRQEGAHMAAQDQVQHVPGRVVMAEMDWQEDTQPQAFMQLGRVDLNSEDWGSERQGRVTPPPDEAWLSDEELDRKQEDDESLLSDAEQLPEGGEDLRDAETGSDEERILDEPSEEEREMQGESQQLYQHKGDEHGRLSATSSPHSQVSDQIQQVSGNEPSGVPAEERMSRDDPGSPREPAIPSLPPGPYQQQSQKTATTTATITSTGSRQVRGREEGEEESHDGSYLWLQRQTQWRAVSAEVPVLRGTREGSKSDHHTGSPSAGYRTLNRGDNSSSSMQDGESRLGVSGLSASSGLSRGGSVSSSPGAIPTFNTLRDQQVSWLSMYRMLEEHHRSELQAQYQEHQQMMLDMQKQLEGELLSQQHTMRQKLECHRQALKESASYLEHSSSTYNRHSPLGERERERERDRDAREREKERDARERERERDALLSSDHPSPLQHHRELYSKEAPARPSRDDHDLSPPPDISREKRLRGGVYSSPMPTAKFRMSSARDKHIYEEEIQQLSYPSERRSLWQERELESEVIPPSGPILSPRTHQSMREKHSKHLADLRSYYEAEIQDLRQKLNAEGLRPPHSSSSSSSAAAFRDSTRERLLQEENQALRLQLRDLQDSLDDAQIHSRDLEQKLQGLERRAADYGERYEESQNTVLKLKNRLEELHSYAKDRESVLEQTQAIERRQAAAIQELLKAKEELEETSRRDKSTIKRLLDKYELLEKDYSTLKDKSAEFEQKLFETRSECVQLNKLISQLELENKRLSHDNDNMRHRLAVSGSLPLTRQELAESGQRRAVYQNLNGHHSDDNQLLSQSQNSIRSRDATPPPVRSRGLSDDEDNENLASLGKMDSPLLRAERELRRLQQTIDHGEFTPRLQTKKYTPPGSLCPASGEVTIIDAFSSPTRSGSRTLVESGLKEGTRRVRKPFSGPQVKREQPVGSVQNKVDRPSQKSNTNLNGVSSLASPTRFDIGAPPAGVKSPVIASAVSKGGRGPEGKAESKPGVKSACKAESSREETTRRVDDTLERIRSGEYVSRPLWEDVYTSLAKPPHADKASAAINMTQEEMLRDRIRSIDQLERRYDNLQIEKRKLESQLNKVPTHGRDRKSRREKELLEERLDNVDHELGSLRMTLKRYQVLKTTM